MGRIDDEDIEDLCGDEDVADQADPDDTETTAEVADDDDAASDEGGAEEEAFTESITDDVLDEFEDTDIDLKVVDDALSQKDQNARALAIRRAIEERLEAKRLSRDLDYLDLELDD